MELPDISGLFGPQDFEREARQKLELQNRLLNEAAREKAISRTDKAVLPVVAGIQAGAMHDFGQSIKNMLGNAFQSKPGTIDGLFPTAAEQQPVEITTAITKDTDSKELREMFSNLQKDGNITLEGKNALVDEMLRRGYPGQAKKFAAIWNSQRKLNIEEIGNKARLQKAINAAKTGNDLKSSQIQESFLDGNNVRLRSVLYNFKDGSSQTFTINDAGDIVPRNEIAGDPSEWKKIDSSGMSAFGRIFEEGAKLKYKADYELKTEELKEWNQYKFKEVGKAPGYLNKMNDADTLLALLEKISRTGGFAANIQSITDFFGGTTADITEFDAKTKEYVTSQLQMMGRNPTDFDLKFLLKVNPGMLKSRQGNIRLLTLLKDHNLRKYELARELANGDYSRDEWYKKILVPAKDGLKAWRKRQKKLFGEPRVSDPASAKTNQQQYTVVPDGQGSWKAIPK